MMMLSSKTREVLKEKAQDSFTIDEVVDVMAHAVVECIREVTEQELELKAAKREEKGNAPTDKEQRDGE